MRPRAKYPLASFYGSRKNGGMTLNAYLKEAPTNASQLADRLGISAASMSRIRNGHQKLSLSLAAKIVAATGGKVTLEDLAMQEAA